MRRNLPNPHCEDVFSFMVQHRSRQPSTHLDMSPPVSQVLEVVIGGLSIDASQKVRWGQWRRNGSCNLQRRRFVIQIPDLFVFMQRQPIQRWKRGGGQQKPEWHLDFPQKLRTLL